MKTCEILHPVLRTKCVRVKNHPEKSHLDSRGTRWFNQRIETTADFLIELFQRAGDKIR